MSDGLTTRVQNSLVTDGVQLERLLLDMAAEIEALHEEVKRLKRRDRPVDAVSPYDLGAVAKRVKR